MSRRLRIHHHRCRAELANTASALARATDPARDQYAKVRAMTDPREDRQRPTPPAAARGSSRTAKRSGASPSKKKQ